MLSYAAPPGYRRTKPVRRPKLDGFTGIVDTILEADTDPDVPRKQRHTAHRIFERLRDEHGFSGGYTIMVPIPKLHDLDTLNERLMARCLERLDALEEGEQTVALLADLEALRTLPTSPFEACEHMPGQVSSTALVR